MSDLGTLIVVLAVQITLPIVGGLLLSRRRRAALACGPLIAAAAAVLILTPLAFAPRPNFTAPSTGISGAGAGAATTVPVPPAAPAPDGIDLLQLLKLPKTERGAERAAEFDTWRLIALVAVALAAVGLGRIGAGLCATARIVRRSRPVADPRLGALGVELARAIGCRRKIALHESNDVGSAATAGWSRPIVVLSPAWRLWSADELRAVLAHEIAHAARGDFAARFLTRLAVALHGYHPLLRWLAVRLELLQEITADETAAKACGGRLAYSKCLAALALKADARPLGFVPTFLSRPRTLLRRIAMLRVKEDAPGRARRWPAIAAIVLLGALALGLRGTTPESLAGPIVPARFVEKQRPPLDAAFVIPSKNADEIGVFAVRVGEVLSLPGMDKMAGAYSHAVAAALGDAKTTHFKLTDIEQVAGRVVLTHDKTKPAPNRSLQMSLTSIRMAKDFDWIKQLKDWCSTWQEHSHADTKYFSGKITVAALGFVDTTVWFYLPDGKTAVLESEENIKTLIDAKKNPRPAAVWADDWKVLESGTLALVVTDCKSKVAKKLPTEESGDKTKDAILKAVLGVCTKASRAAIGIDLGDGCTIKVRLACANANDASDVDEGCQAVAKLAKTVLDDDKGAGDDLEKAGKKLSLTLVRGIEFGKTVDHVVEIRLRAETGITELIKALDGVGK